MTIQSGSFRPIQMGDPAVPLHLQAIHQPSQLHQIASQVFERLVTEVIATEPSQNRLQGVEIGFADRRAHQRCHWPTHPYAVDQSGRWTNLLAPILSNTCSIIKPFDG